MMKRLPLLLVACFLTMTMAQSQVRYLDKVFTGVAVTSNEKYAENINVLTGAPMKIDLELDVYSPMGDTASLRPVILMFGTGNFLPPVINGGPFGSKTDSAMVEICNQFAMRGYVAMGVAYRQGWNPVSSDDNVRRSTLLQAAYRGIHDCRAAIRYLKKSVAEDGNPYGIDTSKIVVGGMGTGGYISTGSAFLSDYSEVATLSKFINLDNSQPYVIPQVHGNIYGTDTTFIPIDTMGTMVPFSLGNHTSYSSDFNMAFHMGGALGDSSWINAGEIPVASVHSPMDPFAPYNLGDVIVPTTGEIVIGDAAGGGLIQKRQQELGNNAIWYSQGFNDAITMSSNSNQEALFAFNTLPAPADTQCYPFPGTPMTPGNGDAGPWNWYNEASFIATWDFVNPQPPVSGAMQNCSALQGSDNDPVRARLFIDTVVQYLAPRIMWSTGIVTGATNIEDMLLKHNISVYPNPTSDFLRVETADFSRPIMELTMMDMSGRTVYQQSDVLSDKTSIEVSSFPAGIYLLEVKATEGRYTQKVIVE